MKFYGGPLHGRLATWLSSPGTLNFTLRGWVGRYDKHGTWVGTKP
jgi:hypothetical protein